MTEDTMGSRLQRLRAAAGMSQSRLAERAGVPIGTLRNWEQDRRVPLLDTAARVAAALGVSLDELAGRPAEVADAAGQKPARAKKERAHEAPSSKRRRRAK